MVPVNRERAFNESDLDPDPHRQFLVWLREAEDAGEPMPRAMALATTSTEGAPWVRMMVLEHVDERGFVFQTNLDSPKAQHMATNRQVGLVFFWPLQMRQVRVTGEIEALPRDKPCLFETGAGSTVGGCSPLWRTAPDHGIRGTHGG